MARIVKGGLIQASNPIPGDDDLHAIKKAMIDKHVPLIEEAGRQGRAGLVPAGDLLRPLLLPVQDAAWYETAERDPRRARRRR